MPPSEVPEASRTIDRSRRGGSTPGAASDATQLLTGSPDEPTLEAWYSETRRKLIGVLSVSSGSRPLAEELADETLVRALEKWDDRVVTEATFAWLLTVGRNLLRRTRRREALFSRFARGHRPSDVSAVADFSPEVLDAIAALAPRQREAIALRYVLGLPCAQIAVAMAVTEGTAVRTLFDARRRLAEALGEPLTTDREVDTPS